MCPSLAKRCRQSSWPGCCLSGASPRLPGRGGVLSGHRGVDYTCASLGVLELDSLSLHFVVCGSSFHVKKEQSHSLSERVHIIIRVKGTPMYCQETGRERVGLGPLVEGLSIMR